ELLQEAERFPAAARAIIRAGIERTADYQGLDYARLYLDRLAPIVRADKDGRLIGETARQLALGMAYEDTIRVAELKIRPSRFETLMGLLPVRSQRSEAAAQLASLRKAANADDTGVALNAAIAAMKEPVAA